MKNILIIWEGLTSCTLLIKEVLDSKNYITDLIYTNSALPFKGIKETFSRANNITKVKSLEDINCLKLLSKYDLIITTGWKSRELNKALLRLKKINKKLIVACSIDNKIASDLILNVDNKFSHTFLKQSIGALYFRTILSKIYDYCFVPGNSSSNLMRLFGYQSHKIIAGYYGASEDIYSPPKDYSIKEDTFLYVGQLIKRKGINILVKAYENYLEKGGRWKLRIIGGNLSEFSSIVNKRIIKKIDYSPFSQPKDIALEMKKSKAFILPSFQDNWGTVACEAAMCGCFLLLSEQSGSSYDLVKNGINGYRFNAKLKTSSSILSKLMFSVEELSLKETFINRLKISNTISSTYNSNSYKLAIDSMFSEKI